MAVVSASFDRRHVGAALRQLRLAHGEDTGMITAINKAALNLEACRWQFDGRTLVIESATHTGQRRYTVTAANYCDCNAAIAGRRCWHSVARLLLINAARLATWEEQQQRFETLTRETNAALFG